MLRRGALIALCTLSFCAGRARAQQTVAPRIRTIARVIATSDVDGRFARPVCDRADDLVPSDHAAFTFALMRQAREEDQPMVLDTGGLLTPHGVARFSAQHRPAALATMVQELGYRALALGLNDLAAPREPMIDVVHELRGRGIPMIASNLRCSEEASSLCRELVDASDGVSMQEVNGRLTAVTAVLRPEAVGLISPDRARGIEFDDPVETIERMTRMARERGAELVIAVVDAQIEGGPIQLATRIAEDARPNLILVSGQDELLFARPSTVRPVLVGAPEGDAVEVRIRESDEIRDGYEMLAQPLEGRGISVAQPVHAWMDAIGPDYCEAWGRPLEGGELAEPIDVDGMQQMVARILRDAAGADVAILNRQVLDTLWRPAREGSLSASDVYISLEYDEPLQVADVDERWLKQLARNVQDNESVVTPGLTWTGTGSGTTVKVGGHRTESRQTYRVVTIRFLAAGGDGVLPDLGRLGTWQTLGEASLRSTVLDYLEADRDADPRESLSDPGGTLEWVFHADADLTFSGSSISNPARRCTESQLAMMDPTLCDAEGFTLSEGARVSAYDSTQLSLSDVLTFGFNVDLIANAAAPDWTWQNTGNLLYRTAWTESSGVFAEAADQIRARSALSWRGLRAGQTDAWYLPDPTVDLFVESEFTEPEGRGYHWFLTRPTVGFRFQLLDKLQLQLSTGFQVQALQENAEFEGGVGSTLTLSPWDITKIDQRFVRLGFTFDYFLAFQDDENRGVLRGQIDAAFDLAGPLALTFRLNLYLQHQSEQEIGVALNATAGFRIGAIGRAVGP